MTELETRMRAMLEKTGLYFGEDKWLSAELAAYAKGLELVYDTLSHVRRDAFVQTAEEDGLKAFESLFRMVLQANTPYHLYHWQNSQLYVAGLFASCTLLAGHIALI